MKNRRKIKTVRAVIDCPVCFSRGQFELPAAAPLVCDDCGFILTNEVEPGREGICIFCGSERFYVDPPLTAFLFEPSLVCYVCEARYEGIETAEPDPQHDEETARELRFSEFAEESSERVELYNQS